MEKINLGSIKIALERDEMQEVVGGCFCYGWGAVALGYEAGVLMNFWNPIGWGGQAALLVVSGYCLTR